jgi:hypothetical protein
MACKLRLYTVKIHAANGLDFYRAENGKRPGIRE